MSTFRWMMVFSCCLILFSCKEQNSQSRTRPATITHVPLTEEDEGEVSRLPSEEESPQVESVQETVDVAGNEEIIAQKESTQEVRIEKRDAPKPKPKLKKRRFPVITFDSTVYHLPDIVEGDVIHRDIHFTNTGEAPLSITYVQPSCGCTQPSFPFLDINPGESGVIGVDYNSVGKEGPQRAELTVIANTYPKKSIVALELNVLPKPKVEETVTDTLSN